MYTWKKETAETAASFYNWIEHTPSEEETQIQSKLNIDLTNFINHPIHIVQEDTQPLLDGIRSTLHLTLKNSVQESRPKAPVAVAGESISTYPVRHQHSLSLLLLLLSSSRRDFSSQYNQNDAPKILGIRT